MNKRGRCALLLLLAVVTLGTPWPLVAAQTSPAGSDLTQPPEPAAEHARLVFDPLVSQQDQDLIAEAVRLAEDFFTARFAASLGADTTVTALPIAAPHKPEVIASTIHDSMVIYAGSPGWTGSPPAERMRTVIHEYAHVYQFSKTAGNPTESVAWFEEGVAEYLSMIAASELGLADRADQEGFFGAIVRHSELPALQELERFDALQAQSGPVYPLAYLGVAYLMQDLTLTAIETYYTALQQGRSFTQAFEQAYGATPQEFYARFAQFRESGLPVGWALPAELQTPQRADRASAVTTEAVPLFVIPGEQALVVAETQPGSNCTLDLTTPGAAIRDRDTFANGSGEVFWLVTVPADASSGEGMVTISCGATPVAIPILVA